MSKLSTSPSTNYLPYNPSRPFTIFPRIQLPVEEFPPPRAYWVDDATVRNCEACRATFSIMLRRHHCRTCGKVFCYVCCNNYKRIPEEIELLRPPAGDIPVREGEQRICEKCNAKVEEITAFTSTLIYKLDQWNVIRQYLALDDWILLLQISKGWRSFMIHKIMHFSKWHEQHSLSPKQQEFIWTHRRSLIHHSRWALLILEYTKPSQVIHVCSILKVCILRRQREENSDRRLRTGSCHIFETKKSKPIPIHGKVERVERWSGGRKECHLLLCGPECRSTLGLYELVEYLARDPQPAIVDCLLSHVDCTHKKIKMMLPFFIEYLPKDSGAVQAFLVTIMQEHMDICVAIYWWFRTYRDKKDAKLYEYIWRGMFAELQTKTQHALTKHIEQMKLIFRAVEGGKGCSTETLKGLHKSMPDIVKAGFIIPTHPDSVVNDWSPKKSSILQSATKPLLLHTPKYGLLFKNDDVRKDAIVLGIIHIMDSILKRELEMDFQILIYPVLPIGPKKGCIEIVPHAHTLFDIKYTQEKSLLVWIMNQNPKATVEEIRSRFVCSCAAFSVINYLLGVGDRHLKNVMITTEGRLFHVDYGYLMGNNPHIFLPEIRLSPEMVEVMGTEESVDYKHFQESCQTIYNILRRHVGLFSTMLRYLQKNDLLNLTESALEKQISQRFRPGLRDEEAGFQFVSHLDKGRGGYSEYFSDLCYYYSHHTKPPSIWKTLGLV